MKSISTRTKLAVVSALALAAALPAIGQDTPESLLPPGFGDPSPPPAAPPPPSSNPTPETPSSAQPSSPRPSPSSTSTSATASSSESDDEDKEGDEEEEVRIVFDVPPAGRRSLSLVGVIPAPAAGFPVDAYGEANGEYLKTLIKLTEGPLFSRWGTILTRRFLASRTTTPDGVNGADWTAERAWLLMRMGDAVVARQLVQQVDADSYTPRLYEVAMPVFLANADLSGMCPLAPNAFNKVKDPTWKMARPICASLAGEQGTATAQLNQARNGRWTRGVDYLLSEKAVGAGTNGRRSVKIEWDKVQGFNAWRFGLAYATGIEPPAPLMANVGPQVDGWRARLPMIDINGRMDAAPRAASLGVLSNSAFVDIYAKAADDPESNEANKALAGQLESAYVGNTDGGKVAAMAAIWNSADGNKSTKRNVHSNYVLTARAAALIAPSKDYGDDASRLVASMMTAGLDTNATSWAQVLEVGSLGWGILAVGSPGMQGLVSYSQMDDFYDNDQSVDVQKSKLLLAGLAGLGRLDAEAQQDFAEKIEIDVAKQTKWALAISIAAKRGEAGTVVLLTAVALQGSGQGSGWSKIPADRLYYITRSLKQVGLEADARMIAAEAVTLG